MAASTKLRTSSLLETNCRLLGNVGWTSTCIRSRFPSPGSASFETSLSRASGLEILFHLGMAEGSDAWVLVISSTCSSHEDLLVSVEVLKGQDIKFGVDPNFLLWLLT